MCWNRGTAASTSSRSTSAISVPAESSSSGVKCREMAACAPSGPLAWSDHSRRSPNAGSAEGSLHAARYLAPSGRSPSTLSTTSGGADSAPLWTWEKYASASAALSCRQLGVPSAQADTSLSAGGADDQGHLQGIGLVRGLLREDATPHVLGCVAVRLQCADEWCQRRAIARPHPTPTERAPSDVYAHHGIQPDPRGAPSRLPTSPSSDTERTVGFGRCEGDVWPCRGDSHGSPVFSTARPSEHRR